MRSAPENRVVLGRVNGLFGVRGWVKVYSYTRPIEAILDYDLWWIGRAEQARPFRVLEGRFQGKTLVARLADATESGQPLADRDAAIILLEQEIAVARSALPAPEDGEFYWVDLVGLDVVTTDDISLGRVSAMMETGANDVLVVSGERERLIPLVIDEFVIEVDFESHRLVVDWDPDF